MKTRHRLALVKAPARSVEGVRPNQSATVTDISAGSGTISATGTSPSPGRPHWQITQQDDETCSMMSPFEKKLYLRQEDLLCSQTVDSQCEVRWDCTSPDAIRHLKKIRKCRNGQDSMSDIVLRFLDDNGEVSTNTPPLLSLWMESKIVNNTNSRFPGQCVEPERKTHSTRRRRRPTGHEEDEAKALLKRMIERCEVIEESTSTNEDEKRMLTTYENGQLLEKTATLKFFSPKSEKRQESQSTSLSNNSNKVEMKNITCDKSSDSDQKNASDDSIWTDDDLFEDNSFILEATQLPAGKRKLNSPAREQPNIKNKRYTFSLTADCDVVPPTAVAVNAQQSVTNTSSGQNTLKNIYQPTTVTSKNICQRTTSTSKNICQPTTFTSKNLCQTNTFTSKNICQPTISTSKNMCQPTTCTSKNVCQPTTFTSKNIYQPATCTSAMVRTGCVTNNNSFKKHSSFDDKSAFSKGSYVQGCSKTTSSAGSSKSTWRRSHSFSGSQSPSNPPRRQPACTVSRSETGFKGTQHVAEINNNWNTTLVATVCIPDSCQQKISATCDSRFGSSVGKNVSHGARLSNKNEYLDTSITDELLYQLAEPDELLESQLTPDDSTVNKISEELCHDDLFDDEMDDVSTVVKTVNTSSVVPKTASIGMDMKIASNKSVGSRGGYSVHGKGSSLTFQGKPPSHAVGGKTLQSGSSHMSTRIGTVGSVAPTQQSSVGKFSFKNSVLKSKPASVQSSAPVNHNTRNSSTVPNMEASKNGTCSKNTACGLECSQDMDDDSFLGDDALFESQILALLDQVESQESVQTSQVSSVKCTSREIEQKRLAALEKQKQKKTHPL
ncbi:uncharacterized protein LOC121372297 [Gigantopelta aegis]|uniref:uncharacterized protein LOC121372297 n=1 Tax=Gigantopelta aegis TaxID=1735272 RepID=UPI001B8878AC|nr:uncharacterized protein LOC121372297 [Gigantopelta aegis]